jgi:hypothetical protein
LEIGEKMNHSLFIEMHQIDIEKQDAIELIYKGKIVMVTKELDRVIVTLKGNGWRAWLEISIREDSRTEVISTEMLDLSRYIEFPVNAVIKDVETECSGEIERCRIEYKYIDITYSVSLISVIDIQEYQKIDDVILRFITKYLRPDVFMNLVRPM